MLLIFLMQALFALTFPIGKETLHYMPPCLLTGLRFICAGLILLCWSWLTERTCWAHYGQRMRTQLPLWAFTTLCYVYLAYVPEFWALHYLTAFKTNLLWSVAPFVSALLEYSIVGVSFSRMQWFGMCLGTLGTLPILFSCATGAELLVCPGLPELALLIAISATSYAWFLVKKLLDTGYSLIWINGWTMLMGGIVSMATGLFWETLPVRGSDWLIALGGALALVIASNIIGYTIYGRLLHRYTMTFLSFSGFLCPIFGAFFCYLWLGEQITFLHLGSFLVISAGLYLFYREELIRGIKVPVPTHAGV